MNKIQIIIFGPTFNSNPLTGKQVWFMLNTMKDEELSLNKRKHIKHIQACQMGMTILCRAFVIWERPKA